MVAAEGGTVRIDDKRYRLARSGQGSVAYETALIPTQDGDPLSERRVKMEDWSRGIGDGRDFVSGGVLYATGLHTPTGRVEIGPRTRYHGGGDAGPITAYAQHDNYLWYISGGDVYCVDMDNNTTRLLSLSGATDLLVWRDALIVARGKNTDAVVFADASPTTHSNSFTTYSPATRAQTLGLSRTTGDGSTPVRGNGNEWSRLDPATTGTGGTWGTGYSVGGPSDILQVFEHDNFDLVLKKDGLYTFSEQSAEGVNILPDLAYFASDENNYATIWNNTVLICTVAGLYRVVLGASARTVGIEEAELNTIDYGYPTAVAGFGKYLYESRWDGTRTRILQYRMARNGDTSMGSPITPVGVVDVSSLKCEAMTITRWDDETRLWYGAGNPNAYIRLNPDGTPVERQVATSYGGSTSTAITDSKPTLALSPTFLGTEDTEKYLRKLEMVMEGSGSVQVQVAGQTVSSAISERVSLNFPKATKGTRFSPVIKLNSANAKILSMTWYYYERPAMVNGARMMLRMRDGDDPTRTAKKMREDIEAVLDGQAVKFVDPEGVERTGFFGSATGETQWQYGEDEPVGDLAITFREADYA